MIATTAQDAAAIGRVGDSGLDYSEDWLGCTALCRLKKDSRGGMLANVAVVREVVGLHEGK